MGIVAGTQGAQGNFFLTGTFQHRRRIMFECLKALFAHRAIQLPSLTETTAADTAALNFQNDTILCRTDKRNHRFLRIRRIVEIHHDFLCNLCRNTLLGRDKRCDCPVLFIGYFIQGRHVHAGHFPRRAQKKFLTAAAFFFYFFIDVQQLPVRSFSLSDVEEIKKFRDRFRIVAAGSAANHDRIFFGTVFCKQRNPGQIQHLQDVCITHFVLQRDA